MNTTVLFPVAFKCRWARVITSRTSRIPARTAEKETKGERVESAMRRARVVFPDPGGPHRTREWISPLSAATRRGRPGPKRLSWPSTSSSEEGRIRSASGGVEEGGACRARGRRTSPWISLEEDPPPSRGGGGGGQDY